MRVVTSCVLLAVVWSAAAAASAGPGPGDANGDGRVDGADYQAWTSQFETVGDALSADFNGDGRVNGADYLVWASAFGQRYFYVDVAGDDGGAGTWDDPWRTIQRAADVAGPGATVFIAPGTYRDPWVARNSGTAGRPITFVGAGPDATVVDGAAHTSNCYYNDGHDYNAIEGMTLTGSYLDGCDIKRAVGVWLTNVVVHHNGWRRGRWDHGVAVYDSSGVYLADVTSHDNRANGVYIKNSTGGGLERVVAHHNGTQDNDDGITLQNCAEFGIDHCQAYQNAEDGIDVGGYEDTTLPMRDCVISDCVSTENGGEGFAVSGTTSGLFDTRNILIERCAATDNRGVGVQIYERAHHVECRQSVFNDNLRGYNIITGAHDVWIHDGVIQGNTRGDGHIDDGLLNVVVENNQ